MAIDPELFNLLCRVYEHYYKNRFHSILKASDFHIPLFSGRATRKEEFRVEYRGMTLAAFVEGIRNNTAQMYGKADTELMDAMTKKFSNGLERVVFKVYWEEIMKEVNAHPGSVKPIVAGVSKLFMARLFGTGATKPRPEIANSDRHMMAISFQIGSLMYEYYQSTKTVLAQFNEKQAQAE